MMALCSLHMCCGKQVLAQNWEQEIYRTASLCRGMACRTNLRSSVGGSFGIGSGTSDNRRTCLFARDR